MMASSRIHDEPWDGLPGDVVEEATYRVVPSRYEKLVEKFRADLEWAWADTSRVPIILLEAELALGNQSAQDAAELSAYKICGSCGRIYTEVQWLQLPQTNGELYRRDSHDLQEFRTCSTAHCGAGLVVTLETYGGMPNLKARRVPRLKLDHRPRWCGGCGESIQLGDSYVAYVPRASGNGPPAPQNLCIRCDITGSFENSSSPPPQAQVVNAHHTIDCPCDACGLLREALARLMAGGAK